MRIKNDFIEKMEFEVHMFSVLPEKWILPDEKLDFASFCEDPTDPESLEEYLHSIYEVYTLKPAYWALVTNGEELISRCLLFTRSVTSKRGDFKLGGIGGLATREEFQKRGIASELLRIAEEKLRDEKCDFCFFAPLTDELKRYYGKRGYATLGKKFKYTGRSGNQYMEDTGMIKIFNKSDRLIKFLDSPEPMDIGEYNY